MKNIINSHTDTSTTARTLKRVFFYTLTAFLISTTNAIAEEWTYDFGTEQDSHTSGASTEFLPAPSFGGGTALVHVGSAGGGVFLNNPGTCGLGTGSELRLQAPTSTAQNRFNIFGYTPGEVARLSFNMRVGDVSGGSSATKGNAHIVIGDDFSSGNATFADVFTGLRWVFNNDGTATLTRRDDSTNWKATGVPKFNQGQNYLIEIFANNSPSQQVYAAYGDDYSLASGIWDLWVDGTRYDGFVKGLLDTGTPMDSFSFYMTGSTDLDANLFLDDIFYSNVLDPGQPFITPSSIRYNLDSPDNLSTVITWNDAKILQEVAHGPTALTENVEYKIEGDNLIIYDSFIKEHLKNDEEILSLDLVFHDGSGNPLLVPFIIIAHRPLQGGENWVKNWNFEDWDEDDNPKLWGGTTLARCVRSESGQGMVGNYALKWNLESNNNRVQQLDMEVEKVPLYLDVFVKGTGIVRLGFKNPHTVNGYREMEEEDAVHVNTSSWQKVSFTHTPTNAGPGGGPDIRAKYISDGDVLYVGAVWFSNEPSPKGWPFAGLDPESLIFDPSQPADVETTIIWNGSGQITSIKKGSETLTFGQDYTTTAGGKLIILGTYLSSALPAAPAEIELTVEFDVGDPVTLTIKTGNPPEISQTDFSYNVDRADDIMTTITWNDAEEVTSIDLSGSPIGDSNYTIGNKVDGSSSLTIKNSYLKGLLKNAGDFYVLTVNFDNGGQPPIDLTITAVEAGLNLVTNEFFSSWLGGHPEDWNVDVTIEESSDGLYGPSSAKLKATAKTDKTLTQYGKSMVANKTYYVEAWVKGKGMLNLGFRQAHSDNAYRKMGPTKIDTDEWTKIEFTHTATGTGNDGGAWIAVRYDDDQGIPKDSELLIGAVWFSDVKPPSDWPCLIQPVKDLKALPHDDIQAINLSWSHPYMRDGLGHYIIKYDTYSVDDSTPPVWWNSISDGARDEYTGTLTTKNNSITVDGLYPNRTYYFAIQGVDKNGNKSLIDDLSRKKGHQALSAPMNFPPIVPTGFKARRTDGLSKITLSWDKAKEPDVKTYWIRRSSGNSSNLKFEDAEPLATVEGLSYVDEVDDGQLYYKYWLQAMDDFNELSEFSGGVLSPPDAEAPVISHIDLDSSALNRGTIYIEFTVTDNFRVGAATVYIESLPEEKSDILSFEPLTDIKKYDFQFEVDSNLIGSSGFRYRIEASDGSNQTLYPAAGWIEVERQTDAAPEQSFSTPSNPEIVFGSEAEEVLITDVKGNEVFKKNRGDSSFIVWNPAESGSIKIESGLYIYRVKVNGGYKYGSVVIVK